MSLDFAPAAGAARQVFGCPATEAGAAACLLILRLPLGQRGLLMVGMRGNAFRTEDLSEPQWEAVPTGVEKPLFDLARLANERFAAAGKSEKVMVLEAGREPSPLELSVRSGGVTMEETFTALLTWKGELYAATDSGVQRIAALR